MSKVWIFIQITFWLFWQWSIFINFISIFSLLLRLLESKRLLFLLRIYLLEFSSVWIKGFLLISFSLINSILRSILRVYKINSRIRRRLKSGWLGLRIRLLKVRLFIRWIKIYLIKIIFYRLIKIVMNLVYLDCVRFVKKELIFIVGKISFLCVA